MVLINQYTHSTGKTRVCTRVSPSNVYNAVKSINPILTNGFINCDNVNATVVPKVKNNNINLHHLGVINNVLDTVTYTWTDTGIIHYSLVLSYYSDLRSITIDLKYNDNEVFIAGNIVHILDTVFITHNQVKAFIDYVSKHIDLSDYYNCTIEDYLDLLTYNGNLDTSTILTDIQEVINHGTLNNNIFIYCANTVKIIKVKESRLHIHLEGVIADTFFSLCNLTLNSIQSLLGIDVRNVIQSLLNSR